MHISVCSRASNDAPQSDRSMHPSRLGSLCKGPHLMCRLTSGGHVHCRIACLSSVPASKLGLLWGSVTDYVSLCVAVHSKVLITVISERKDQRIWLVARTSLGETWPATSFDTSSRGSFPRQSFRHGQHRRLADIGNDLMREAAEPRRRCLTGSSGAAYALTCVRPTSSISRSDSLVRVRRSEVTMGNCARQLAVVL